MCRSLPVAPEIIEDTNEVAIKIGSHELAQLPRFVLGLGNDVRMRGLPLCEEFVHLSLAVEIEPEKDRARVPCLSPIAPFERPTPPFPGFFLSYPSRRQQPAAPSALIETLRL
jgi:hypothetical protein